MSLNTCLFSQFCTVLLVLYVQKYYKCWQKDTRENIYKRLTFLLLSHFSRPLSQTTTLKSTDRCRSADHHFERHCPTVLRLRLKAFALIANTIFASNSRHLLTALSPKALRFVRKSSYTLQNVFSLEFNLFFSTFFAGYLQILKPICSRRRFSFRLKIPRGGGVWEATVSLLFPVAGFLFPTPLFPPPSTGAAEWNCVPLPPRPSDRCEATYCGRWFDDATRLPLRPLCAGIVVLNAIDHFNSMPRDGMQKETSVAGGSFMHGKFYTNIFTRRCAIRPCPAHVHSSYNILDLQA